MGGVGDHVEILIYGFWAWLGWGPGGQHPASRPSMITGDQSRAQGVKLEGCVCAHVAQASPAEQDALFPCRNYSAVCVYSLGDIDRVFRVSSLKGYHTSLPNPRPGKVSRDVQLGPTVAPTLGCHSHPCLSHTAQSTDSSCCPCSVFRTSSRSPQRPSRWLTATLRWLRGWSPSGP